MQTILSTAEQLRFSIKTTLICGCLALGMLCASYWQWGRHIAKQNLILTLQETLKREPTELAQLALSSPDWSEQIWRRVSVSGVYDFSKEVIVRRNRGATDEAGFHVITPLKIDSSELYVLVDRGFIPLGRQDREYRKRYQRVERVSLYGLVKGSSTPKFLAPKDPQAGLTSEWVDLWIRVNIEAMQRQLPYQVLPVYIEILENPEDPLLVNKIVKEGSAGRNDILALTGQRDVRNFGLASPDLEYPLAHFDTTPPPDIHLGYVYEWAFMAVLTVGIGIVAQLRRRGGE